MTLYSIIHELNVLIYICCAGLYSYLHPYTHIYIFTCCRNFSSMCSAGSALTFQPCKVVTKRWVNILYIINIEMERQNDCIKLCVNIHLCDDNSWIIMGKMIYICVIMNMESCRKFVLLKSELNILRIGNLLRSVDKD